VTRDPLDEAAEVLRHDAPAHSALIATAVEGRRWWLQEWPDGAPHVLCLLAQDLQDLVHESVDALWPVCAEHGDHPLLVEPDLGPDPFWVCHRTGLPVAAVGSLPA
jgi:hypothetical protein